MGKKVMIFYQHLDYFLSIFKRFVDKRDSRTANMYWELNANNQLILVETNLRLLVFQVSYKHCFC